VRLSHKSETVAENGETTATVALLCDSVDRLLHFGGQLSQAPSCRHVPPAWATNSKVHIRRRWLTIVEVYDERRTYAAHDYDMTLI